MDFLAALTELIGASGVLSDPQRMAPYLKEPRNLFHHTPKCVVLPKTSEQVVSIVRFCQATRIPMVPQGGNTGLCGGAMPTENNKEIILSLAHLQHIREVDPDNNTITVEAGCIVARIREIAAQSNRLFPLSFGADGSARIGGSISANSGGTNVLRYGNARELVLGLEVVLANGELWNGLGGLRKDNTGYDLKHLFIGSEGTLGIITAATLKLFPLPARTPIAWVGLHQVSDGVQLLQRLQDRSGGLVSGCELVSKTALDFAIRHIPGCRDPLTNAYPWYLLLELGHGKADNSAEELLLEVLEESLQQALIADAVLATSIDQGNQFWRLRESVAEAQSYEGGSIKHDVSVPVSRIAELIVTTVPLVEQEMAGIRPCIFGHLGDGNLHFNLSQPVGADKARFLSQWGRFNRIVHDQVIALGGSISAEHGIGQLKTGELAHYKDPVALALMGTLKLALDPYNLLNPGKVLGLPIKR